MIFNINSCFAAKDFFIRVAQNEDLRNKKISPTRVSLGMVSFNAYTRLILSLVQRYQWMSIYILLDVSVPSPLLPVMMQAFVAVLRSLPGMQVITAHRNFEAGVDLDPLLTEFQSASRGRRKI